MNERIELIKGKLSDFRSTLKGVFEYKTIYNSFVEITSELEIFLQSLEEVDASLSTEKEKAQLDYLKYEWSLDAIDLSILLRDSLLAITNKNLIAFSIHNRVIDDGPFDQAIKISENLQLVLEKAISETEFTLTSVIDEPKLEWKHQKSPIPTICEQLGVLKSQQEAMFEVHERFTEIIPQFNEYREHVLEYNMFRLNHLRNLESQLLHAKELILEQDEEIDAQQLAVVSGGLQKISGNIENEKVLTLPYEDFLSNTDELEVPIYADGGELFYRTVDLDKNVETWTDSEIQPKILDADADISNLYDSALISLFNTRNKIESLGLSEQEAIHFDKEVLTKAVEKNISEVQHYFNSLEEVIESLNVQTAKELKFENIFDRTKEFLPELGFINLSKFRGQKTWYRTSFWSDIRIRTRQFFTNNKIPFIKSLSADPYAFIESKEVLDQDIDSNSLFLKKGYLGRSFYIQRTNVESKVVEAFDRWQNGFQGSVLIKGDYGSGKSCLIEYMPHLLTKVKVVQVNLHNTINLLGRKHTVTYTLSDTINFIAKQSITSPVVACIDDIEKWQHGDQTMYDTVRDLVDGISKYGKRIFFVVSTNHFMLEYIERMFDFKSRFASCISTDTMYQNSIANALVIRHNASTKDYNEDENPSLAKKATKISRKNNHNIGASMLAWERSTSLTTQEILLPPPSLYQVIKKHELILKVILTNKLLNESSLRQCLSSSDNNFISEELRKLKGYKIVRRTFDGYLQINPTIVFYIEDCLKTKI